MFKAIAFALLLTFAGWGQESAIGEEKSKSTAMQSPREAILAKAIEKQEMRHFELHRFFIPLTQGNLQWLSSTVGAKPEEALVIWKLMREWDLQRAMRMRMRGPS